MKKVLIAALALMMGASMSLAAIGIMWDAGGWMVAYGESPDLETLGAGVAQDNDVLWQLIFAGEDNVANEPDLTAENFLGGDDKLVTDRQIAQGGGAASDGSSWNEYLEPEVSPSVYDSWTTPGFVYQRIWQGTPSVEEGGFYYDGALSELKDNYSATDPSSLSMSYYDAEGAGVAISTPIEGSQVPEPATMSLLGLGALAMVLRRKIRK